MKRMFWYCFAEYLIGWCQLEIQIRLINDVRTLEQDMFPTRTGNEIFYGEPAEDDAIFPNKEQVLKESSYKL